jgi:hypothetical protein
MMLAHILALFINCTGYIASNNRINIVMSAAIAMKQTNQHTSIARQRLGKQVPAVTNTETIIEALLGYSDGNGVLCWVRPEAI